MAQGNDGPAWTQADQGSLHVIQLFDFSYTVLTFDETLVLYLRTAERVNEQIQSSRVVLSSLGAEVSILKRQSVELAISQAECCARILTQDLEPAKSESSSPQDIIRQSRLFLVLRSDNHEASKDLESLHHACNALDRIIESCKSVRANSIKRKPLHLPVTSSTQPSSVASPPAITVDIVNAEQPSTAQQTDDFLNGLPPLDATKLLHHRRTSRLRNRSLSQRVNNDGQSEQQANDPPQNPAPNDPANTFELPGWPNPIPIPPPTARGYVFIPTLTSMPELEAPSEIISVTKAKPDYAASLRSPTIEPGVHQVHQNDESIHASASKPVAQSPETVAPLSQSQSQPQPQPTTAGPKGSEDPVGPAPALDTSVTSQDAATSRAIIGSPQSSIVQATEAHHGASRRSSSISDRSQSMLPPAPGPQSSESTISPYPTSNSSRVSETPVPKSTSTRNRLRKTPLALASRSSVYLANSPGGNATATATASNLPSAPQTNDPHTTSSTPALTALNQTSQKATQQVPSVSVTTKQLPGKVSRQTSDAPNTTQPTGQVTNYAPTLTVSPQFQTTKSFSIVSPTVSPSREDFPKQYPNSNFYDSKRHSITSIASAPPSTGLSPSRHHQNAYTTQQQTNIAHDSRPYQAQYRTYSLPETSQHKKNLSMDERWLPQRAHTQISEVANTAQNQAYASKLAREAREERMTPQSNIPNTSVARAPNPPYPMTPIHGPVRSPQHESMRSVPTRMPFPPKQDSTLSIQSQSSLTQQSAVSSSSVSVDSHRASFRFEPPRNNTRGDGGNLPLTDTDLQRPLHLQQEPQPKSHALPPTPTLQSLSSISQNAGNSMQQHSIQQTQPQFQGQTVQSPLHPQQQQYQQPRQYQQSLQYQQPPSTIPTTAPPPPIPPKINHQSPPTIPDADLHREHSTSGTKSDISSRSSTLGLRQQLRQQHAAMHLHSVSSSTLSTGLGIVGDGGGGGGGAEGSSNNGSTLGAAGPSAVGRVKKRSSWLARQVERAGLKSF